MPKDTTPGIGAIAVCMLVGAMFLLFVQLLLILDFGLIKRREPAPTAQEEFLELQRIWIDGHPQEG